MGDPIPFRRPRRLPPRWALHGRRGSVEAADARIMLWLGLLLGLLAWQAMRLVPATESVPAPLLLPEATNPAEAINRYAEAERSRAILEAQENAPRTSRPESGARISRVSIRVIDGDTIDHDGVRVRLADIDTPEVRGRCAHETELAARATRRLRALLADGAIALHPLPDGRDEDRYGRKLRIVTRDGRSVGDMLVAKGLARTWTGRREPWCA